MMRFRLAMLLLLLAGPLAQAAEPLRVCKEPGSDRLGYGDRLCRMVIPYRYLMADPFDANGLARVTLDGDRQSTGVIDRGGKQVLAPVYDAIQFGPRGQMLAIMFNDGGRSRLFDAHGRLQAEGPPYGIGFFQDGLAVATGPDERRKGYIEPGGRFVISPVFDNAEPFARNGLAVVVTRDGWGFIDRTGKLVIPARYGSVDPPHFQVKPQFGNLFTDLPPGFGDADVARVHLDDSAQLIDATGRTLGSSEWSQIGEFDASGHATVYTKGPWKERKVGVIDTSGRVVVPLVYDAISSFDNGYAMVTQGTRCGHIDVRGDFVMPLRANAVCASHFDRHGVAKVLLHPGRDPGDATIRSLGYGYIDTHGTIVIDKDDYDRVDAFQDAMPEPLARAVKAGKTGYLDTHGKLALGWYDAGTPFGRDGLAAVKVDGKFGYIDRQGRFVIVPAYEDARRFDGDTAVARLHGKWGIIDHAGKVVVPFEYDQLEGFKYAAITLGTRAGREVGVDRLGDVVALPPLGPLRGVPIDEL